jgi:hypothetical protein
LSDVPAVMLIVLVFFVIIHVGFEPIFGELYEELYGGFNVQYLGIILFVIGAFVSLLYAFLLFLSQAIKCLRLKLLPKFALIISITFTIFILLGLIDFVAIIFGYFKSIPNRNDVYIEYNFINNFGNNLCPDGEMDCQNSLDMDLFHSLIETFWIEDIYKGGLLLYIVLVFIFIYFLYFFLSPASFMGFLVIFTVMIVIFSSIFHRYYKGHPFLRSGKINPQNQEGRAHQNVVSDHDDDHELESEYEESNVEPQAQGNESAPPQVEGNENIPPQIEGNEDAPPQTEGNETAQEETHQTDGEASCIGRVDEPAIQEEGEEQQETKDPEIQKNSEEES